MERPYVVRLQIVKLCDCRTFIWVFFHFLLFDTVCVKHLMLVVIVESDSLWQLLSSQCGDCGDLNLAFVCRTFLCITTMISAVLQ